MYKLYKKCEKSLDNLHGSYEIPNVEEYDKPFLLCITPLADNYKAAFGLITCGAEASRVRTSNELAGGFKIDEMPIDFLGFVYDKDNTNVHNDFNSLFGFIYSFLKKGKDIKKQARKINIFAFCNSGLEYAECEKRLEVALLSDGYTEGQIDEILSQISLVTIASVANTGKLHATSIAFKDVNDRDINDKVAKLCAKKMIRLNRDSIVDRLGENALVYAYNGFGDHLISGYFADNNIVKPTLCSCVSTIVENAIKNANSEELIPLNCKDLLRKIIKFNGEFEDIDTLTSIIDDTVDYGDVGRYNLEEHKLLLEKDNMCKELAKQKQEESRKL